MYAGVKLKQAFGGTGYNEQIRHFPDFASRMYFMPDREVFKAALRLRAPIAVCGNADLPHGVMLDAIFQ